MYKIQFKNIPMELSDVFQNGTSTDLVLPFVEVYTALWKIDSKYKQNPQKLEFLLYDDMSLIMDRINFIVGNGDNLFDATQQRFFEHLDMKRKNNQSSANLNEKKRYFGKVLKNLKMEIDNATMKNATMQPTQIPVVNSQPKETNYQQQIPQNTNNYNNEKFTQNKQKKPELSKKEQKKMEKSKAKSELQNKKNEKQISQKNYQQSSKKNGIIKTILLIIFIFSTGLLAFLYFTGIGQKTVLVKEENPTIDVYRTAITTGAKDAAEKADNLTPENISSKDKNPLGLIYVRNGEYDKALNYISSENVENILFESEDVATLKQFVIENPSDLGDLDVAILDKNYPQVVNVFESNSDWDLSEKRIALVSLSYLHEDNVSQAKELASKTNSQNLQTKISDYESLQKNLNSYNDQMKNAKEEQNKELIQNKIDETQKAINQLFQ